MYEYMYVCAHMHTYRVVKHEFKCGTFDEKTQEWDTSYISLHKACIHTYIHTCIHVYTHIQSGQRQFKYGTFDETTKEWDTSSAKDVNVAVLQTFLAKYKAGELKRFLRSDPVPQENDGPILEVCCLSVCLSVCVFVHVCFFVSAANIHCKIKGWRAQTMPETRPCASGEHWPYFGGVLFVCLCVCFR
jgi:hypothetical protein